MNVPIRSTFLAVAAALAAAACDPIDTSALQDIEKAAAAAQVSAEKLNARAAEIQGAIDDPVGAVRQAALGATFTKTPTAEANLFVLTDLQTGCQWLATYGPDSVAASIAPRTEPDGQSVRQRCITIGSAGIAPEPWQ
ncbi:hypothetical protein [Brevundimonas sp. UBA2416]|uniref:hypothetical protein n=1 Tax=Brevundimonas sp. UBA2416 TaxID=1946124 RepID=UPI0025C0B277|nr:hypothetical protein [Brevundimonas sp. UBA2416]